MEDRLFEYEHLATLSLGEVLALFNNGTSSGQAPTPAATTAACRRLLDIAYCDEGVDAKDRALAAQIEKELWEVLEEGLSGNPNVLQAARTAHNNQLEYARSHGVGSLAAKVSGLDPKAMVGEIVKLENAGLLNDFPRSVVESMRGEVLRELLRDRSRRQSEHDATALRIHGAAASWQSSNVILAAAWLILIDDPTMRWICTEEELRTLGRGMEQYNAARNLLCGIGTILSARGERPHSPPDHNVVRLGIGKSCSEDTIRVGKSGRHNYLGALSDVSDTARNAIMMGVFCLRATIWKTMLRDWFGREFSDAVFAESDDFKWIGGTREMRERIEHVYTYSLDNKEGQPCFAKNLVAEFVLDEVENFEEKKLYLVLNACEEMFKSELYHFPQYVLTMVHSLTIPDRMLPALVPDALLS